MILGEKIGTAGHFLAYQREHSGADVLADAALPGVRTALVTKLQGDYHTAADIRHAVEVRKKEIAVLPDIVNGVTSIYRDIFRIEEEKSGYATSRMDTSYATEVIREGANGGVVFEGWSHRDRQFTPIEKIIDQLADRAYQPLWGKYVNRGKSALSIVMDFLHASLRIARDNVMNGNISAEEAFFAGLDFVSRAHGYGGESGNRLCYFLAATEEVGKIYGLKIAEYLPQNLGRFDNRIQVIRNRIYESEDRMKFLEGVPVERLNYLRNLAITRTPDGELELSVLDIYLDLWGLNTEQVRYSRIKLLRKYPILQGRNIEFIPTITAFAETFLRGKHPYLDIDENEELIFPQDVLARQLLPHEAAVDIRVRAARKALSRIEELKLGKWQDHYRSLDILEFDRIILQAFIEETNRIPLVADVRMEDIFRKVADASQTYLSVRFPEGVFEFSFHMIEGRFLLLSHLTQSQSLTAGRSGRNSKSRVRGKNNLGAMQKDIGLRIDDRIMACNFLEGGFERLSLKVPPLKSIYTHWWNQGWEFTKWERMAEEMGGISFSIFTYLAKTALINTILSPDGRRQLIELGKRFSLRNIRFVEELESWDDAQEVTKRYKEAIDIANLIQNVGRLTSFVTEVSVGFCAGNDYPVDFERYILKQVATGKSGREICRNLGLKNLADKDPRFLGITEMIKIHTRYPFSWADNSIFSS